MTPWVPGLSPVGPSFYTAAVDDNDADGDVTAMAEPREWVRRAPVPFWVPVIAAAAAADAAPLVVDVCASHAADRTSGGVGAVKCTVAT
jgi:hypothetical protein